MRFSSIVALVALVFPTVSHAQQWRLQITDEATTQMFSFKPNTTTPVPLSKEFKPLQCNLFSKASTTTLACSQSSLRFGTVVMCKDGATTGANLVINVGKKTWMLTVYCIDDTERLQKIKNTKEI